MADPITDPKQAGKRLLTFVRENRLVQQRWQNNVDGRELACLLGAAARIDDASQCPASLMPPWLSSILPVLFDSLQEAQAISFARRWGEAMVRDEWTRIDWDAVRQRWLSFVVQQAKTAAKYAANAANAAAYAAAYASYAASNAAAYAAAYATYAAAYAASANAANAAALQAAAIANAASDQADELMDAIATAMVKAKEAT